MDNKSVKELVRSLFDFIEDEYHQIKPAGLLRSRVAYGNFNPSAGHHIVDPVIQNDSPHSIKSFSILERCLREADSSRGLSNRHLGFFEMFAFHAYGKHEHLPKSKTTKKFYKLLTEMLCLEKDKLMVTVLDECDFENQHLDKSETEAIYSCWVELLGQNHVKRTIGERNLFIARMPGAAGGSGFEVYYKMIDGKYIEIGSQVDYHYIYHGPTNVHPTTNGTLGSGLGLERLLMAMEDRERISDISLISPIKEVVRGYLRAYGEDEMTIDLYDESLVKIADSIRAIMLILHDCGQDPNNLSKSQRRILNKFRRTLNSPKSELNYLGIYEPGICEDLVDVTIGLFEDRYPNMPQMKSPALDFINPSKED